MLKITDTAVEQFKNVISKSGETNSNIRVFVAGGGCCSPYGLDITENGKAGDASVEKDGLNIYVDPAVYEGLSEATVDYRDGSIMISGRRRSSCCG